MKTRIQPGRRLAAVLLALAASPAFAAIGTIDNTPGATLLYPHFEVDANDANGINTVLTLQNSSATAILANVVLWTDYGLPTAHFNVYLTGYDQQAIDLRTIFRRVPPRTASDGQDPNDTISPQGRFSQDINFASCSGLLPDAPLPISANLAAAHSGQASIDYFNGQCGARNLGDGIARGYVTVDTVNQCTTAVPGAPGYFVNGGAGIATHQNVMYGDYVIVDPARRSTTSETAVAIEADPTNPLTSGGANKQTFYGRLVGFTAADNREPLPTAWAGRASAGRTDVDYWRDPGVAVAPFACGGAPAGLPAGQKHAVRFNDAGTQTGAGAGDLFPFGGGTTTGSVLGVVDSLGWLFVNANLTAPSGPLGFVRQSWLTFRQVPRGMAPGGGTYTVPGIQLGNAATGDDPTP
ncbi:hypothetical protein [Tahibacter soli]|uniref:Uncharacterized protein n=1 Tax=Tahibacter soli TaxID=2983605 RepID=A0A9X3YNA9_9GAMM|nr:hypothetical protein [Tahibacter soli]MDC8014837.1 hypothetical protein [Tahibacter soli]